MAKNDGKTNQEKARDLGKALKDARKKQSGGGR